MRTKTCVAAAITALALCLTACGGAGDATIDEPPGDVPAEPDDGDDVVDITMGVLPIVPSATLQLGVDEGIFAEHGFEVSLETGQGGAALLPAVMSGQMEFAISNPLSVMLARGEGLDVRMVTGYSHSLAEGDDITSVWVLPGSGISEPADLEGRTVAVNTLRTMGEVSINEIVNQAGGDHTNIQYVEMGFPDMPAALDNGNIDAAWVPEPFQTIFGNTGAEMVSYNYQETMPGVSTMSVITSGDLVDSDPELVERFVAAVDEITAFAQENPGQVRETLTTFLDMDQELAEQVLMEDFGAEMDVAAMQALADLSLKYGVLTEPVDMDSFMPAG